MATESSRAAARTRWANSWFWRRLNVDAEAMTPSAARVPPEASQTGAARQRTPS